MRFIVFLLLAVCSQALARDRATHQSLTDLLAEVRDPVFKSQKRIEYLEFSRRMMKAKLASELKVSQNELNLAFVKNPLNANLVLQDPWIDLQTEFYTTLHQENFRQRWMGLQKLVKFTDYGKGITSTMMAHWGNYSPAHEGRFYARWSKFGIKTAGKTRNFNLPFFLMSDKIQDLISMEAHEPYEDLFSKEELNTFLKNTSTLSRVQKQEVAEKMTLNRKIYIRAIANSAKTIASLHYLSGELNRVQSERKVASFLDGFCDSCSQKEKREYQNAAMVYVDTMKKGMTTSTLPEVVNNFCSTLKRSNYHWNVDQVKPTPVELLANQAKLIDYYVYHKLKGKNKEALAKTILSQDLGVLFLTGALNHLDKTQEPVATKLGCTKNSTNQDVNLIRAAIDEAETNIETYAVRVGQKISSSKYNLQKSSETVEYFVQTNQTASIEAASSFPQGIGWVLKSIAELEQNVSRRKKTDKVIAWGGTILGIGLTLTGFGAPEGVAILISTAGVIKGVASGSYMLVRARQEKQFAQEMRLAKNGSAGINEANLRMHYADFKDLKVGYIKEFAGSAISFGQMYREALKITKDVPRTHSIIKRVIETAKSSGKEEAIGKVQEMVIELAMNVTS
jgi:flagellar biosynthesis regulator FlaF